MKKNLLTILILFWFCFFWINQTQALSVADFTPTLDKNVAKIKTTKEKVEFLKSFSDLLNTPTFTKDKNVRVYEDLREYTLNMLKVFEYELKEEEATKSSKSSSKASAKTSTKNSNTKSTTKKTDTITTKSSKNLPHLSDNFTNIDEQKVRDAILSRHNEERKSLWLENYKYNLDLEWSATVRAIKLAASSKTKNLHVRNSSDWYYNYNSILNWFSNLWIKFPNSVKWASSFSESVWYWSYKCSKSDCTQTLIDSIKRWTWKWLIIKEKEWLISDNSHYKAAIMKHFTQMWLWIAIDKSNNRYYIVLHYWVDF